MAETTYKKLPLNDKGEIIKNSAFIKSPRNMSIISFPKSGKTESMVDQPNILIGDCEGGSDYFAASNVADLTTYDGTEAFRQIKSGAFIPMGIFQTVDELKKANRMTEWWTLFGRFSEAKGDEKDAIHVDVVAFLREMKFPIFATDTLTHLADLNQAAALEDYNNQFPARKKGNIKRVDDYGGSQYIRRSLVAIKNFIEANAAPFIIYTGHIKEKKKILEKGSEDISAVDMALEGQLGTIFTAKADANAIFYRNKKGCFLDFRKKDEEDMDSRPRHLANKVIKLADLHEYDKDGNIISRGATHWDLIYPELDWTKKI